MTEPRLWPKSRFEARLAGKCEACISIPGRSPGERRYWWTGQDGASVGLCESCCTIWRMMFTPRLIVSCREGESQSR